DANRAEVAGDVLRFATERGLPAARSVRLAAVIDEMASSGARQTGQVVTVRLWGDKAGVVCEVADRAVIGNPLVGRAERPTTQPHDRDVRLANELCDLVQVRSDADGTTL